MCIHATWLKESLCTRCNLKPQLTSTSLGILKGETVKRRISLLPKVVKRQVLNPQPEVATRCVGCQNVVNPAFCYRGSVLSDLIHTMHSSSQTTPVLGVMRTTVGHASTKGNVETSKVLGGETITSSKPIAFRKRTKGLICPSCAACISTVEHTGKDGVVERIPVVQTDERGGYIGETARGSEEAIPRFQGDAGPSHFRRGPAFNTRVTQGRTGKRV